MFKYLKKRSAQSVVEYVMIVAIVAAAVIALSPLVRRGIQSIIKTTADQVGMQNESDQQVHSSSDSYLAGSFTSTNTSMTTTSQTIPYETHHQFETTYGDMTNQFSNSITNLGFTNRN